MIEYVTFSNYYICYFLNVVVFNINVNRSVIKQNSGDLIALSIAWLDLKFHVIFYCDFISFKIQMVGKDT